MIEKFAYIITNHNNIKVYRMVGAMQTQSDGSVIFAPDMTKVQRSHNYTVRYRLNGQPTWRNPRKTLYDTYSAAEQAAKAELEASLIKEIENYKKLQRLSEERLANMKIKFHNCGGK